MTTDTLIKPQTTMATDRLSLRPMTQSDLGLIALYAGASEIAECTRTIPHPMPPGAVEAMFTAAHKSERTEDTWVIDGASADLPAVLGLATLNRMDRDQSEVSAWIAPAFWNMGVASEALGALIAANPHGSRTLFGEVFQSNPASARVLTNQGFEYLGDAEAHCLSRDAVVPTWTYMRRMG